MTLTLVELSPDNLDAAIALPPAWGEKDTVAPVVYSIAEAYVNPTAWLRLIMDDDQTVGFVMANWDLDNKVEAFRAGIWRLNVAHDARGRGVGTFAVEQVVEEARRRGVPRITVMWELGPEGPEDFYRKLGFTPTGEVMSGEMVGVLDV